MKNVKFKTVGLSGDDTKFRIEQRVNGLWSGGPEICIAHILKGRRSPKNPSIPLDKVPELIEYLAEAYGNMREDLARQKDKPVS